LDTNVTTKSLGRPGYVLTVRHESDDNSYISSIIRLPAESEEEGAAEGDTIYSSFPQTTPEEAEQAARDYFAQLAK
jgi:hypothetical protein